MVGRLPSGRDLATQDSETGAAPASSRRSLGVDPVQMRPHATTFVDKILKAAKPGDIPIEQATRFKTIVNLKTAKALGIDISPTVLAGADEVIE
jgi:putative tryptophan/tyrosine transport system substrate-binding protein